MVPDSLGGERPPPLEAYRKKRDPDRTPEPFGVDGANVCLTADETFGPFEKAKERCVPLNGDKVGDSWKSKSVDAAGKPVDVDVSIVAGQ